jgi:hypothetical protein
MNKLSAVFILTGKKLFIVVMVVSFQSCYQYRVLKTNNDPSTEYETKILWSYAWGLANKPKDFHVHNCKDSNALDEVVYKKKFGHSLLTLVTLGIVSPVEVKWKCHKPCQRVGDGL